MKKAVATVDTGNNVYTHTYNVSDIFSAINPMSDLELALNAAKALVYTLELELKENKRTDLEFKSANGYTFGG
jgi:hypothetical protein